MRIRTASLRLIAVGATAALGLGLLVPAAGAANAGTDPNVEAVRNAASAAYSVDAKTYLTQAIALLGPSSRSGDALSRALPALQRDVNESFVDGARLRDHGAALRTAADTARVVGIVQTGLKHPGSRAAIERTALTALLVSARQSTEAQVDDLKATLGGFAPGSPGLPLTGLRKVAPQLLSTAVNARNRALAELRAGHSAAALAGQLLAVQTALSGLKLLGVTYSGDQDGDGVRTLQELPLGASPLLKDTDGDGLTDGFEILKAYPFHVPTSRDTDGNGKPDPAEDVDGDHRDAAREQRDGTDPLSPDAEPNSVPAPAVGANGVQVTLDTGRNDTVQVDAMTPDETFTPTAGLIGSPFQLSLAPDSPGFGQATLKVPYPATSADPADLRLMWFDETNGFWVPSQGAQHVDPQKHLITATVTHFSIYAVFDIRNWGQSWTGLSSCQGPSGPGPTVADVAFVLDSSGSMADNDPEGLRRQAAKNFVDAMRPTDRAAVVDFDDIATLLQPLTTDRTAVKSAIDLVDDSGGTNIGAGVFTGLDALAPATPDHAPLMILLTDGVGSYDPALTQRAIDDHVTIYTIGLGSGVDATLLDGIATATGGSYHAVSNASDLPDVFSAIGGETGQGQDTDGDGVSDCQEIDGVRDGTGHVYTSDPRKADTDGDGLNDGEELGPEFQKSIFDPFFGFGGIFGNQSSDTTIHWRHVVSDPRKVDGDGDGLDDVDEVDAASSALIPDTDGDGVRDLEEFQHSTDPANGNTDGDGFSDRYEIDNLASGFNPTVPDAKTLKWSYALDFALGAVCGTTCEKGTIAWLTGNLTVAAGASAIPVVGWIVQAVADIRDAIGSAIHSDWVGSAFAVAGVLPYAGDAVEVVAKIARFTAKYPAKAREALALLKVLPLSRAAKVGLLRKTLKPGVWDDLRTVVSEDRLVAMADKGFPLEGAGTIISAAKRTAPKAVSVTDKQLERKFMKHAPALGVPGNSNPANWRVFEQAIRDHVAAPDTLHIVGKYQNEDAILSTNLSTGVVVVQRPSGEFWSAWTPGEEAMFNVLSRARLGGH